ncbi:MAG: pantoate--beta-alanine ligase [Chitinophagales bacterium]|nr:pantoate--beta-alanine ligase [Chitinophagales bacterium]MDW8418556.1 pantoate--beta-alanine ligase [Chitinophagales bacterium]
MLLFKTVRSIKKYLNTVKKSGKKVGFIPTMGALHEGHLSLLKAAKRRGLVTVCSIFVNPTQFNDPEDFKKYPVTTDSDLAKLHHSGCEAVFLPSVKEIYPHGTAIKKPQKFGFLSETLEGEFRPGHFEGMAQVVERLLRITEPDYLFMGLKDYQQQLIVGQLIKRLGMRVKLVSLPTVREIDGLAMSSRNTRLSESARKKAKWLYKELSNLADKIRSLKEKRSTKIVLKRLSTKNTDNNKNSLKDDNWLNVIGQLTSQSAKRLAAKGFIVEYLEVRNAKTLSHPKHINEKLVVLVAARLDGVRLIDNVVV